MREFIIKFETDKPLSELASGTNLRAMMKVTGDCDEIIRCKDCKHWNDYYGECESPNWSSRDDYFVTPAYFYCGWAERKEE